MSFSKEGQERRDSVAKEVAEESIERLEREIVELKRKLAAHE